MEPYWARIALKWVRPATAEARASRGVEHRAIRQRFVVGWDSLDRYTWPWLFASASKAGHDLNESWDGSPWGRGGLPALILEAAYWWAVEREHGKQSEGEHPGAAVRGLADELLSIDAAIRDTAADLSSLLRRRTEIAERKGLSTQWEDPGLRLLPLLRETIRLMPKFEARVSVPLDEFVLIGRQTSVSKPQLADLLDLVANGVSGAVQANHGDDLATLTTPPTGSGAEGHAALVRRFFGAIDELDMTDRRGKTLRPLDWLSAAGLSALLSVAAGMPHDSPPFTVDAVKKLRQRYRKEGADS